jgi:CheY-like chemotaxis protein
MSPKRVLVVDDEPTLVRALLRTLRHLNVQADSADDGLSALEKMATNQFDLVISDLRMPGLDGAGLLKQARERNLLKGTFVFLTGHGDYTVDELKAMGADAVYFKPMAREQLIEVFESWLKQ